MGNGKFRRYNSLQIPGPQKAARDIGASYGSVGEASRNSPRLANGGPPGYAIVGCPSVSSY